jgi:hypothetical protein
VPVERGIVDAAGQQLAAEQLLTLDVGLAANGMLPDALQPEAVLDQARTRGGIGGLRGGVEDAQPDLQRFALDASRTFRTSAR